LSWPVFGAVGGLVVRAVLDADDLVQPLLVATAVEAAVYPSPDDLANEALPQHSAAEHEHVGVVVLAGKRGTSHVVHEGRANAVDLVRGDRHADAGAAQQDAALGVTARDTSRDRLGVIGIIDGGVVGGTEIARVDPASAKLVEDDSLGRDRRVVARDQESFD
jgi:hypothetical protein